MNVQSIKNIIEAEHYWTERTQVAVTTSEFSYTNNKILAQPFGNTIENGTRHNNPLYYFRKLLAVHIIEMHACVVNEHTDTSLYMYKIKLNCNKEILQSWSNS